MPAGTLKVAFPLASVNGGLVIVMLFGPPVIVTVAPAMLMPSCFTLTAMLPAGQAVNCSVNVPVVFPGYPEVGTGDDAGMAQRPLVVRP